MASLSGVLTVGRHFPDGVKIKTQSIFFTTGIALVIVQANMAMEIMLFEVKDGNL